MDRRVVRQHVGSSARTRGVTSRSSSREAARAPATAPRALRWLMESDVCKHCTHAACLDVCPTGALFRTEFGTVVVQEDICNGCGYCVPACPFGVLDKRHIASDAKSATSPTCRALGTEGGRARVEVHALLRPAEGRPRARVREGVPDASRSSSGRSTSCASAPTRGSRSCTREGWNGAQLYGRDPDDGVGGFGAFFLLLDDPEVYGLPPDPVVTTKHLGEMWRTWRRRRGARASASSAPSSEADRDATRRHEMRSYYGRPVIKEPTWTWEIPSYFFTGGVSRRVVGALALGEALRQRAARAHGAVHRRGRRRRLAAAARRRPRPAGALPPHAARLQGDLADERRRVDPARERRRVEHGRGARARSAGSQPIRLAGRGRRRALRPAARDVHRRAARRHGGAGLARGAAGAAVALRRERGRVGRRGRVRVPRPARTRARRGGSQSAASSPRASDAGDGAPARRGRRGLPARARRASSRGPRRRLRRRRRALLATRGRQSRGGGGRRRCARCAGEIACAGRSSRPGSSRRATRSTRSKPQRERAERDGTKATTRS